MSDTILDASMIVQSSMIVCYHTAVDNGAGACVGKN
jgi:hypothetical protein